MSLSYHSGDYAPDFNSVYRITLDMSGWDKTAIHVLPPMLGTIYVYGGNYDGNSVAMQDGSAELATHMNPIQATNLATGTAANTISAAGTYKVEINDQFLRLQGSPAGTPTNVYGILFNHSKIG
jgi:hypothetical protein